MSQTTEVHCEESVTLPMLKPATIGLEGTPGQGPHMVMVLRWDDDVVAQASYSTYGCPVAHSCGTYVAEAVEGKTVSEAMLIDEDTIISAIGKMPLGRAHCPRLAVNSLIMAVEARVAELSSNKQEGS